MQTTPKVSLFQYISHYWLFFILLVGSLVIGAFHLNQSLFYIINTWHVLLPVGLWKAINYITYTKYGVLPIVLVILTFIFKRDKLSVVVLVYLLCLGVLAFLKSLVGEARPFMVLPMDSFFWLRGAEDAFKTAYKSFPSGHTGNMAAFTFIFINVFLNKSKKPDHLIEFNQLNLGSSAAQNKLLMKLFQALLFLSLILTGFARICTGWHWPLDVLYSGLIIFVLVNISFYVVSTKRTTKLD